MRAEGVQRNETSWRAVLLLAVIFTLVNSAKPMHMDDPFYYYNARRVAITPLNPYGGQIFWQQWPKPAIESLSPPVFTYWWALGLRLLGEQPLLWKWWMLPFAVLLVHALHVLFERFARPLSLPLLWAAVLSPALLPSFNLMVDIPALALGLCAVVLFMRAVDDSRLPRAVAAGVALGLAVQTKYTAMVMPGVMLAYVVTHATRRFGAYIAWLAATAIAGAMFLAWEGIITLKYGKAQFWWQFHHGFQIEWDKPTMAAALLNIVGGMSGATALVAITALVRRWSTLVIGVGGLSVAYTLMATTSHTESVFTVLGAITSVATLAAASRLCLRLSSSCRHANRLRTDRDTWFLVLWLALEVAGYFALSPFPAVRRALGVFVVIALIAGRLAARTCHDRSRRMLACVAALVGIPLGLAYFAIDLAEARAARQGAQAAAKFVRARDDRPTIWFLGHWGFQFYAERSRMRPLIPDHTRLRRGDWLLRARGVHAPAVRLSRSSARKEEELTIAGRVPLSTVPAFYSGDAPLERLTRPRISVEIYRVTSDCIARTAWPVRQTAQWSMAASGASGAFALPALVRGLRTRDAQARGLAAIAIAKYGARARPAVPALVAALDTQDRRCLRMLGNALAVVDSRALIAAVQHERPEIRRGAVYAIGSLGKGGRAAAPALLRALEDPDEQVRRAAREALKAIGPLADGRAASDRPHQRNMQ